MSLPIDEAIAQANGNMSDRQKIEMLREKIGKIVAWLDRLEKHSRDDSKRHADRFPGLSRANALDADNYKRTADDLRAALTVTTDK